MSWVRPFKYPDLPQQQMELERRVKEHSRDSAGEPERGEKEMAWEKKIGVRRKEGEKQSEGVDRKCAEKCRS